MKEFKLDMINRIVTEARGCRIVSLHDVGVAAGYNHISAQDCRDIINAVLAELPDYKVVKMAAPGQSAATASLWTTAAFVDRSLEFEEGGEF